MRARIDRRRLLTGLAVLAAAAQFTCASSAGAQKAGAPPVSDPAVASSFLDLLRLVPESTRRESSIFAPPVSEPLATFADVSLQAKTLGLIQRAGAEDPAASTWIRAMSLLAWPDRLGIRLVGPVAGLFVFAGFLFFRSYSLPDAPDPSRS